MPKPTKGQIAVLKAQSQILRDCSMKAFIESLQLQAMVSRWFIVEEEPVLEPDDEDMGKEAREITENLMLSQQSTAGLVQSMFEGEQQLAETMLEMEEMFARMREQAKECLESIIEREGEPPERAQNKDMN